MRIRTIKPEFWTNEKLSYVSEQAHTLAAALLNYSDDEGYFNANPKLIKAALYPLREPSMSIQSMLMELSNIDYLRLGKSEDGREYGWIVSFLDHQVISRPTPSKIKHLCEFTENSMSHHGVIMESSVNTHGGMERKGKEQGKDMEGQLPLIPKPKTQKQIATETASAFLIIFNAVFDRKVGAASMLYSKIEKRLSNGLKPWQILCAPILQYSIDPNTKSIRNFSPEMLLRDGTKTRTGENGTVYGATDWIERIYMQIDTVCLDEKATKISQHFGVFDDLADKVKSYWRSSQ